MNNQSQEKAVQHITLWGALLNIVLSALKVGFGIVAHSQALIADGVHSLSDLLTDASVWFGVKYWNRPADEEHPYGHGRIESLVTLFIGIALFAVSIELGKSALIAFQNPHTIKSMTVVFWVALASVLTKEGLFHWTAQVARKCESRALFANAWHHRSDALSSLPVLLSVVASYIWPDFPYFDGVASILVVGMLITASTKILWGAVHELLDQAEMNLEEWVREEVKNFPIVHEVHKVRSRRVGGGIWLDFHLLVDGDLDVRQAHDVSNEVKWHLIEKKRNLADVLIHIEPDCEALGN